MTMPATEPATTAPPVWREVGRAIAERGAKRCFGLVGGANFKVTHALTELGVEFIAARHEGGAVTMADVAARLGHDLTVASVTAGPRSPQAAPRSGGARKERHAAAGGCGRCRGRRRSFQFQHPAG